MLKVYGVPRGIPVPSELRGDFIALPEDTVGSVPSALAQSPSVQVSSSGGEASAPMVSIRGHDASQSRYFLDGVPLSDAEFNVGNVALVPAGALNGLEVFPEGVPTFLAEDGLGGAVQLRLNPNLSFRHPKFSSRLGSYEYIKASVSTPVTLEYVQSRENFFYFDDGGTPYNPSDDAFRRRENNDFKRLSILPRAELGNALGAHWSLWSLNSFSQQGVPGSTRVPMRGEISQWFSLSALRFEGNAGARKVSGHLFYRRNQEQLSQIEVGQGGTILSGTSCSQAGGVLVRLRHEAPSRVALEGVLGGNLDAYSRVAMGHRRWHFPGAVSASIPWFGESVKVKPALLGSYFRYEGSGTQRDWFLVSPRLAADWDIDSQLRARGSLGAFYRAPAMAEWFGSGSGITGNPRLNHERAVRAEVGGDWVLGRPFRYVKMAKLSYNFGLSNAEDLIAYIQNSQRSKVGVNIGKSRIATHEASLALATPSGLSTLISATWLKTWNLSAISYAYGRELPNRPSFRSRISVEFRQPAYSLGYTWARTGAVFVDIPNEQRMGAISDHAVTASVSPKGFGTWQLELLNLTDAKTNDLGWGGFEFNEFTTGYAGYPAPGRRVYLSWTYKI